MFASRVIVCMTLALSLSPVAEAQQSRVLLPVVVDGVPGAFGSMWRSDLWIQSKDGSIRDFDLPERCFFTCPPPAAYEAPRQVPFVGQPGGAPAIVAHAAGSNAELVVRLRVQDVSRQAQTWGTEVPVIWESEFVTGTVHLLPVPTTERFRSMLRIYALDGVGESLVRIRVFSLGAKRALLSDSTVTLIPPPDAPLRQYKPWYRETLVEEVAEQVTVEVTPVTPGLKIWAFISSTNDDTQHVTTISPER